MTIRLNPANLAQTRSDLGLTVGTDVLAPNGSGANLTALNASALASGTVPTARLGSGTASGTTFLAGDQTYKTLSSTYVFLSEFTASSSASAEFTSLITSSYDDYLFIINGLVPATDQVNFRSLLSTDNGSSYLSSTYAYVVPVTYFLGASGNGGNNESTSASFIQLTANNGNDSDSGLNGNLWLWNVNDAAKRTCMYLSFLTEEGSNFGAAGHGWGFHPTAATHNAVKFNFSSGNMASGTIKMYGIKNA